MPNCGQQHYPACVTHEHTCAPETLSTPSAIRPPCSSGTVIDSCVVCTLTATKLLHNKCLTVLQLVDLADSALSGKIQHIPDNMYDLDADWEIDPKALTLMEKIGGFTTRALPFHHRLEQGLPMFPQACSAHSRKVPAKVPGIM